MDKKFIPLLFAGDINVVSVARAFHEEYGIVSSCYGKYPTGPCMDSKIIDYKANEKADFCCTIAGKCCESGDLIAENIMLQNPCKGDILAVLVTGAYNYAMASNYNRIPRPPVVILKDGESRVALKRESYADLTLNDI